MKSFAFGLLMLVACAAALPQISVSDFGAERRDIAQIIVDAIERFSARITDPVNIERAEGEYVLFLPTVFSAKGRVENLRVSGQSDIRINRISYSPFNNIVDIDISLPSVSAVVGGSSFELIVLGREISGSLSGLLQVNGLRVSGTAKVVVGAGVSVTEVDVEPRLGSIQSALAIRIFGLDLSAPVNNWLNSLPANLALYQDLIKRGLDQIIAILLNHFLN
ncbi:PREDICTED: uncharacterized protein LOC106111078 [Papilio polytes]|uniref:uncharacterized protein LOC106111078 n=1 Tax=Papilio polytes TaxID=76194 RepID=UPI000676611D|nr:PREDICTED: uncharacterized protein LOC106111078 [Papilio polytes]